MRSIIKFIKEKRTAIIGIFIGVLCGITCFAFFVNIKSRALVATNVDIPKIVKAGGYEAFGVKCMSMNCGISSCGVVCCAAINDAAYADKDVRCKYYNGKGNGGWTAQTEF